VREEFIEVKEESKECEMDSGKQKAETINERRKKEVKEND